jgi:hypothetical protein
MKFWARVLLIVGALLAAVLALWLWVISTSDPLRHPLASRAPWPVACSTRGCIYTTDWVRHADARRLFATEAGKEQPTSADTLTTLIRQHLAHHTVLPNTVTIADARRYREDILNLKDSQQTQETTGLDLAAYDQYIVVPFLEQEQARQIRKAETIDDLYKVLAGERWIIVLPFSLGWNKEEGKVTTNSLYHPAQ